MALRHLPCVILCGLAVAAAGAGPADERYLVIRYDDYPPTLEYAAGRDVPTVESRLFDMAHRHGARLVVGVVPFPILDMQQPARDPHRIEGPQSWLSQPAGAWLELLRTFVSNGTVEPALHGYEHRLRTPKGHRPGEFRDQSFEWQRDAIRLGRDALAAATGVPVRVFVPPWNAWDDQTGRALDELGFEWCSADFLPVRYQTTRVRHIPQCYWEPEQVLRLAESSDEVPADSVIVLVTHPFDFHGERAEGRFRALEELLKFTQSSPKWKCVGFSDLPAATDGEWDQRFRRAVKWQRFQALAHDAWGPGRLAASSPMIVRPASWYDTRLWRWRFLVLLTLLLSAGLTYLVVRFVVRAMRLPARWRVGLALVAVGGVLALVLGAVRLQANGYAIRGVRWQAICVGIGVASALWIRRPRARQAVSA
jgi:peptidoglycan/xylan/chitin deacetylase (PgdA/CDA1 family)